MQLRLFIGILFSASILFSCSGNRKPLPANNALQQEISDSLQQSSSNSSQQILDTTKLKSDLNDIVGAISNGRPDTNKLKKAGADILSADAAILSDSGISKMYGNSNDPAVITAKNMLLKMRNSIGITPAKLDSIKKAAAMLSK
ncbi:MAG: hypothetical protein ABI863_04830 [Ginsengibacter sp.]